MKSLRSTISATIASVFTTALVASILAFATPASASVATTTPPGAPIRPNQLFGALVNGRNGVSAPAVIKVVCVGTDLTGKTGHPLRGQNVSVFLATGIARQFGDTGAHGDEIGAFFGPPPPVNASSGPVVFTRYGTKRIPTSEVLPCSGHGDVTFVPLPMSPGTSRDVVVPVSFVALP
jgi:hypothetical protein